MSYPANDVLLLVLVAVAAYTDIRYRKIYDKLTLPMTLGGLVLGYVLKAKAGLAASFWGLLVGLALLIIPCELGAVGGGDAKLLMAIGALEGKEFVLLAALLGMAIGGIASVRKIASRAGGFKAFFNSIVTGSILYTKLEDRKIEENLPYGVFLVVGSVLALICRGLGIFI